MKKAHSRERGSLLVEAMVTLTILSVAVLGVMTTIRSNFRATQDIGSQDTAHFCLETAIATLRATPFANICSTYQDTTVMVSSFVNGATKASSVQVHFDINEKALPAAYGPIADLDGDGVLATTNVAAKYYLLPTKLTITHDTSYGTETELIYLVLMQ